MRTEAKIFIVILLFLVIVTPVYWFMSKDPTGTAVLILSVGMAVMIAGYLSLVARKIDLRPEDRADGEIVEGAGELGFFPPQSYWPVIVAGVVTLMFLGPVFGWWLTLLGAAVGIWAVCGWVYEFYRGDYAH